MTFVRKGAGEPGVAESAMTDERARSPTGSRPSTMRSSPRLSPQRGVSPDAALARLLRRRRRAARPASVDRALHASDRDRARRPRSSRSPTEHADAPTDTPPRARRSARLTDAVGHPAPVDIGRDQPGRRRPSPSRDDALPVGRRGDRRRARPNAPSRRSARSADLLLQPATLRSRAPARARSARPIGAGSSEPSVRRPTTSTT